jgi:hypothetical protein
MQNDSQTYRVGNMTFIVTPVYHPSGKGESLLTILLKLMKADIHRR